jgi:predicted negative regulator of RcsB-dependent stress response
MNSELLRIILDACQALTIIAAAITIIWQAIKKAKLPNETQNARLNKLEDRMDKAYELFAKDKIRLDTFAEGERITQQALLALMSHAINGNDTDKLETAKNKLEEYLINK